MDIKLWEKEIPLVNEKYDTPNKMTTYLLDTDKPVPAVIVLPGGGYAGRAPHEAEPISKFFNSRGFHSFVVHYRVSPYKKPVPLIDAQRAIKLVRYHAADWKVDPDKVFILGFSAGGHLCASTAVMEDMCKFGDEIDKMPAKPSGAVLCYPVIDMANGFGHDGSTRCLLGHPTEEEKQFWSLQNRIDENTPPCFLWHTSEDEAVPVKNSLAFAEKLAEYKIPYELHVFPKGQHGLGLAEGTPDVSKWAPLCADWIDNNF